MKILPLYSDNPSLLFTNTSHIPLQTTRHPICKIPQSCHPYSPSHFNPYRRKWLGNSVLPKKWIPSSCQTGTQNPNDSQVQMEQLQIFLQMQCWSFTLISNLAATKQPRNCSETPQTYSVQDFQDSEGCVEEIGEYSSVRRGKAHLAHLQEVHHDILVEFHNLQEQGRFKYRPPIFCQHKNWVLVTATLCYLLN